MRFQVWYCRASHLEYGIWGLDWCRDKKRVPDPLNLTKTHFHLKDVEALDVRQLFDKMQIENWPDGEAGFPSKEKGVRPRSMSVGDIAVDESGATWVRDVVGWVNLGTRT